MQRVTLRFSAIVEAATGLALVVDPALVARLLLGADVEGVGAVVGRCFGIALIALAAAPQLWALFVYNAGIALYLGALGALGQFSGWLLWPAVALHAAVALILARTRGVRASPARRLID